MPRSEIIYMYGQVVCWQRCWFKITVLKCGFIFTKEALGSQEGRSCKCHNIQIWFKNTTKKMGGMDINDKLIHLNEVAIQSKSWGYLKKFNSCINICQVTGLLLYGIFSSKLYITQKHQQIVLKFIKNRCQWASISKKRAKLH